MLAQMRGCDFSRYLLIYIFILFYLFEHISITRISHIFDRQSLWPDPRNGLGNVVQRRFTALHVAAQGNCSAAVEALLDLGADVEAMGDTWLQTRDWMRCSGIRPLFVAAQGGCLEAVHVLLARGACTVDAKTSVGYFLWLAVFFTISKIHCIHHAHSLVRLRLLSPRATVIIL
jgi:hypothetical protein